MGCHFLLQKSPLRWPEWGSDIFPRSECAYSVWPCLCFRGMQSQEVAPVNSSSHDGAQSPGWPGCLSTVTQLWGRAGVHPDTPLISFTGPSSFYLSHKFPGRKSQAPLTAWQGLSFPSSPWSRSGLSGRRTGYTVRNQPDSPVSLRTTSSLQVCARPAAPAG